MQASCQNAWQKVGPSKEIAGGTATDVALSTGVHAANPSAYELPMIQDIEVLFGPDANQNST